MTLIELMVVVVILVTLVGGVLPLVSPNNDARKIAEASRGLQTYFMQAQAEAARIGRPVGVGFRETAGDSGIALEAFQMNVPQPYSGSSSLARISRVPVPSGGGLGGGLQMEVPADSTTFGLTYGPRDSSYNEFGNGSSGFPAYNGFKLYGIHTQPAIGTGQDSLPPKMFRVGDVIEAEGNRFVIVDDPRNVEFPVLNSMTFLDPRQHPSPYTDTLICIRLEDVIQGNKVPPLAVPPNGYPYAIHRQPMGSERTSKSPKERIVISGEPPFQLPAGIAIDLVSSGFEAQQMSNVYEFPQPKDTTIPTDTKELPYSFGIMFSPNGGVDAIWVSGQRILDASRVFFLLGRAENGNPAADLYTNWDGSGQGQTRKMSDEEFKDRQSKVNWLNLDSRWLVVNANDGRLTSNQNALVDPRNDVFQNESDQFVKDHMGQLSTVEIALRGGQDAAEAQFTRNFQIEAAHALAHQHSGGNQDKR